MYYIGWFLLLSFLFVFTVGRPEGRFIGFIFLFIGLITILILIKLVIKAYFSIESRGNWSTGSSSYYPSDEGYVSFEENSSTCNEDPSCN